MTQTDYLGASLKRSVDVALRLVIAKIERYNLSKILAAKSSGRYVEISINNEAFSQAEMLDGCYVIKSNSFSTARGHFRRLMRPKWLK